MYRQIVSLSGRASALAMGVSMGASFCAPIATSPALAQQAPAQETQAAPATPQSTILSPIVVKTPLMGLEDHQVIELGYQMGLPFHASWTCQMAHNEVPCMSCPACARRTRAFRAAQLADPLVTKK